MILNRLIKIQIKAKLVKNVWIIRPFMIGKIICESKNYKILKKKKKNLYFIERYCMH